MADWLGGYSAEWSVTVVDPDTWEDMGTVPNVMSVSVSRDGTDDVPLIETGSMEVDGPFGGGSWYRVWMRADQDGSERVAIATLLFERQSSRFERGREKATAKGRSVLQPAADRKMPRGSFVPAGGDGAAYAASLLRECIPAPVSVDGSFTLVNDFVFDLGCSYLDAAWQVLKAGGWVVTVDGHGRVTVSAKPEEPALELDSAHAGLLVPGVDEEFDISEVPNRYVAVDDDDMAEAVNEDEASPVSRPSRGRWVEVYDTSPTPVNGETLQEYAIRRLEEESTVTRTFTYTREFWPDVVPFSLVRASLGSNGIEGDLRVMRQELDCGTGVTVNETSGMEVRL